MIKELTQAQWDTLPGYMQKWIDYISTPSNPSECQEAVELVYKAKGFPPPICLHFSSPLLALMAASLLDSQLHRQFDSQLRSQLDSQLDRQLITQLDSQLDSQLRSQLDSQLDSQLQNQLDSQLDSQLRRQFDSQIQNQIDSQLQNQLDSQLDRQLRSQIDSQIQNQLDNQLITQLDSQLDSQLRSQIRSQIHRQLDSQLITQLDSQLDSQLRSQIHNQFDSQLISQLRSQIQNQFDSQFDRQLNSQLIRQLRRQLDSQLRSELNSHYVLVWRFYWACYYDFAKSIGVKFDEEKLSLYINFVKSIHACISCKNFFIYSDKPTCRWKGKRLHNEKGMAVEYTDGWGWYALNGIVMKPKYVLTPPDKIKPETILAERNVDQRRELIRKVGVFKLSNLGKTIDTVGTYKLIDMSPVLNNGYDPFLLMLNPSVPDTWHLECVSRDCKTVEHALNWRKPNSMKKIPVSQEGEDWYQQGDVVCYPKNAIALKPYPTVLT